MFKKINEANEVLSDPEKRKRYDLLGENWQAGQDFRPPPGWDGFQQRAQHGAGHAHMGGAQFGGFNGFSDFFEMLFGNSEAGSPFGNASGGAGYEQIFGRQSGSHRRPVQEGQSHEIDLPLSLGELYRGGTKSLQIDLIEQGSGKRTSKSYQVKLPPGITDGGTIRMAGQGSPGSNGKKGDLLLKVRLEPDPRYKIDGFNLRSPLAISPWEAALGTKISAPTPDGSVTLTIPPGSQAQQQLRLRGKGLLKSDGTRGDLLLEIHIQVPKTLSAEERSLMERLNQVSTFNPRA